ncbi:hypothetical protein LCGC14_1072090 [marine sediment metagenome]|uniref:Uncharacterized protein n=1 Tax=marine sediment metagenome TaxID=412755 RepID=A0A0F9MMU6_9ZZZZ
MYRRVRERFVELANRWHDETDHLSSASDITNNDTYLKIISMGEAVIPLILLDLRERGGSWYRALRILSDADPVPTEVRGEVPKMKEAWLRWGRDQGYDKCICPIMDNQEGIGGMIQRPVINLNCPVHGDKEGRHL